MGSCAAQPRSTIIVLSFVSRLPKCFAEQYSLPNCFRIVRETRRPFVYANACIGYHRTCIVVKRFFEIFFEIDTNRPF
jgi:hypothetical protein